MTTMYKTAVEKAKQRFNVTLTDDDVEFRPTTNDRNNAMLRECQKFAQALRAVDKDLCEIDASVTTGLNTVRKVLETPLPRAYEEAAGGAFPATRELTPVGTGVHTDALMASSADAKLRLQSEVLQPISQWLSAYRAIKDRNGKLEEVRLELDVKRRSFVAYKAKYLKSKAKAQNPAEQESIYNKAQTEEDKMNRLVQRYVDMEEEVYQATLALVNDTVHLRDYLFAALFILKGSFAGAIWAFKDAYPGLNVEGVPESVLNVPKATPVDVNSRFGYLAASNGLAASKDGPSWLKTTPRVTAEDDGLPTATISELENGKA